MSVSSQSDTERADLAKETRELREQPEFEKEELAEIYVARGLEPKLAREVAKQLMAKDALAVHARDELGISEITTARPVQAALASAATFSVGAAAPLVLVAATPANLLFAVVAGGSLAFLALLGIIGAKAGGAHPFRPAVRVTFWGAFAMALTAAIGSIFWEGCLIVSLARCLRWANSGHSCDYDRRGSIRTSVRSRSTQWWSSAAAA